jgi:hypothetical protein
MGHVKRQIKQQHWSSLPLNHEFLWVFLNLIWDTLNLIKNLSNLGIRGKEPKWFEFYLSGRQQYVELEHTSDNFTSKPETKYLIKICSKLQPIKHSVAQGSILGPLLFLCCLKGLPVIQVFETLT